MEEAINNKGILRQKSFDFALRVIKLRQYLLDERKESVLSRQILRCGTSIGANVRESRYAESRADMAHKFHIALKEAEETHYWLELLFSSDYLTEGQYQSLIKDCEELIKILIMSIKTLKKAS